MNNITINLEGDELTPPKVTGSPERIWLNYGDLERNDTHDECYRNGEVTWCQNSVFDSDVEYVRADAQAAQAATIAEQAAQIEALRAENERLQSVLKAIWEYAHDKITGPTVWDGFWEIRSMAYSGMDSQIEAAHGLGGLRNE